MKQDCLLLENYSFQKSTSKFTAYVIFNKCTHMYVINIFSKLYLLNDKKMQFIKEFEFFVFFKFLNELHIFLSFNK